MKKTRIVATVGPATDHEQILEYMIEAGVNVCRFNFSHGTREEHKKRFDSVKAVRRKLNLPVAVMMDTKGPEIRIREFENGSIELKRGDTFTLACDAAAGNNERVSVNYPGLYQHVGKGDKILLDDGLIELRVKKIQNTDIITTVENGGELQNNKSINIPGASIMLPTLTDKDKKDIIFAIKNGADFIAASFIRSADDVQTIRRLLKKEGGSEILIVSKIENREGVENIDEIIQASDGIMVARGDLGVEIPAQEVPMVQKTIIRKCNKAGIPVITATQMLDSMIRNPRPTRAEVGDVANAVFDGTDAVMLSGETAAGKYPVESVATMAKIVEAAEILPEELERTIFERDNADITNTIGYLSCTAADLLKAKAILTPTTSGYTTRMIARFRPQTKIIAVSENEIVPRRLMLTWGAQTLLLPDCSKMETVIKESFARLKETGALHDDDLVVITAGLPMNVGGTTNMLRVAKVGDYLLHFK